MTTIATNKPPDIEGDLAAEMEAEINLIDAQYAAEMNMRDPEAGEWLTEWYIRKVEEFKHAEEVLVKQFEANRNRIRNEARALAFRHGIQFKQAIDQRLQMQKGKAKSVSLEHGRAGYRKKASTVLIKNGLEVLEWCKDHCPDALDLKIARRTPIKEHIESTGEIPPGVDFIEEREAFYPPCNAYHLPEPKPIKL